MRNLKLIILSSFILNSCSNLERKKLDKINSVDVVNPSVFSSTEIKTPSYTNSDLHYEKKFLSSNNDNKKIEKFNNIVLELRKKYKLCEEYFPLFESYNNSSNTLRFMNIKSLITTLVNLEQNEDLSELLDFYSILKDNILSIRKNTIVKEKNVFPIKGSSSTDFYIANYFIDSIFSFYKDKDQRFVDFLSATINIGTYYNLNNYIDYYDDDNEIIQLSIILQNTKNNLKDFTNKYSSYIRKNIENFTNFNFDFYSFYKESISKTNDFGIQNSYNRDKVFSGIKNTILNNTNFETINYSINQIVFPASKLDYIQKHDLNLFNNMQDRSIAQAEKINYFVASYETLGRYNTFFDFLAKNNESKYNNLTHSTPYFENNSNLKVHPLHTLPIKKIDLTQSKSMKVHLGSLYLYETQHWLPYGGLMYKTPYISEQNTNYDKDKNSAISLLRAFNLNEIKEIDFLAGKPLLLPTMPEAYIEYSYSNIPGIIYNNNVKLNLIRKLQSANKNKFMFEFFNRNFYQFAIDNMYFSYIPTEIEIVLNSDSNILLSPSIPLDYKNNLTYKFIGNGGSYYLKLEDRVNYIFESNKNDKWFIDARLFPGDIITMFNNVFIGNKMLYFSGAEKPVEILILQKNGMLKSVNLRNRDIDILTINSENFNHNTNDIIDNISKDLINSNQTDGYIEIENYNNNNNKDWYDINSKILINPDTCINHGPCTSKKNLIIIGKNNEYIYFFDTKSSTIYYTENLVQENKIENELKLLQKNVMNFNFIKNELFIKTENGLVYSVINPNNLKIKSIDKSKITIDHLKELIKDNIFSLSNEIIIFNNENDFIGWYITENNQFIDKSHFQK